MVKLGEDGYFLEMGILSSKHCTVIPIFQSMNILRSIAVLSIIVYSVVCNTVCIPGPLIRPNVDSCEYVVTYLREKSRLLGPGHQVQTFVPPSVRPREGQHVTPAMFVDKRHSTQRSGRLCAARIEVLAGRKPASITIDQIADIFQNIIDECLILRSTLGWERGGTDNRLKIWLDRWGPAGEYGQPMPVNANANNSNWAAFNRTLDAVSSEQ